MLGEAAHGSLDWHTVRFGDVVRNVDEAVRDPLTCDLERFVGLDHIDPESLRIKRWGLIADGTSFTRKFTTGQVLFGKRRAYQRKVAVADFDGLCSSDILVFEPADDQLLPELLPFIVQTEGFFQHALGTSAGSLSPRTRWRDLAAYVFTLPPLDEQRRIAEIMWAADDSISRRSCGRRKTPSNGCVWRRKQPRTFAHAYWMSFWFWVYPGGTPSTQKRLWDGCPKHGPSDHAVNCFSKSRAMASLPK
jgi:hypothetical protein